MHHQAKHIETSKENRSPLFGSWAGFYVAVIAWLGLLITFFYFFTKHFSH